MVKIRIWLSDSLSQRVGELSPYLTGCLRSFMIQVFTSDGNARVSLAINFLPDSSFSTGCGRASRIGI